MSVLQALAFLPPDNQRAILTATCVSPLFRLAILRDRGLSLGACKYELRDTASLHVKVERDVCSPPPEILCISSIEPKVHFEANDMSLPTVASALSALSAHRFCCIEIYFTDAPNSEEQQQLSDCLSSSLQRTERLEVKSLRYCGGWNAPATLKCVELDSFSGSLSELFTFLKGSSIDTLGLADTNAFTEMTPDLSCIPSTIKNLRLDGSNCQDAFFPALPCAMNLRRLSLDDCDKVTELDVSSMVELRSLSAARTAVSGDSLLGLRHCTHLHHLNLSACAGLYDVNALGELQNLRELFIHETAVTNSGIVGLSGCCALEKLNLGGCTSITNVNCLGSLRCLKELHLWMTRVNTDGIAGLSGCISLVEVVFDGCARLSSVSALRGLPRLRFVSLSQTNVDTEGIKALESCPALETLDVRGTRVDKPPKLYTQHAVLEFFEHLR